MGKSPWAVRPGREGIFILLRRYIIAVGALTIAVTGLLIVCTALLWWSRGFSSRSTHLKAILDSIERVRSLKPEWVDPALWEAAVDGTRTAFGNLSEDIEPQRIALLDSEIAELTHVAPVPEVFKAAWDDLASASPNSRAYVDRHWENLCGRFVKEMKRSSSMRSEEHQQERFEARGSTPR